MLEGYHSSCVVHTAQVERRQDESPGAYPVMNVILQHLIHVYFHVGGLPDFHEVGGESLGAEGYQIEPALDLSARLDAEGERFACAW